MARPILFFCWLLLLSPHASTATWEMESGLNIHGSLRGKGISALPQRILVPKGYVIVSEETSANVEEIDPKWSGNADNIIQTALLPFVKNTIGMEVLPMPTLTDAQQNNMDQHIDLFELVLFDYIDIKDSWHPAWQHKRDNMDVTVGPGLSFLKSSGADSILVVLGKQNQSSLIKLTDSSQPGSSFITFGLVELETGNVIWTNTILSSSMDFQSEDDINSAIESAFKVYPRY